MLLLKPLDSSCHKVIDIGEPLHSRCTLSPHSHFSLRRRGEKLIVNVTEVYGMAQQPCKTVLHSQGAKTLKKEK